MAGLRRFGFVVAVVCMVLCLADSVLAKPDSFPHRHDREETRATDVFAQDETETRASDITVREDDMSVAVVVYDDGAEVGETAVDKETEEIVDVHERFAPEKECVPEKECRSEHQPETELIPIIATADYLDDGYLKVVWGQTEAVDHVAITVSVESSFVDAWTEKMPDLGEAVICPWDMGEAGLDYYVQIFGYDNEGCFVAKSDVMHTVDYAGKMRRKLHRRHIDEHVLDALENLVEGKIDGVFYKQFDFNMPRITNGQMFVETLDGELWSIELIGRKVG